MNKQKEENNGWKKISVLFILSALFLVILVGAVSWVGDDVEYQSFEDSEFHYNLSANITSPATDMQFAIDTIFTKILWDDVEINVTQISSWVFIADTDTGDLVLNATRDNQTGRFRIPIKVTWDSGQFAITTSFNFTVNATNDAPRFVNLENRTINMSELFEYTINITDEENNIPFALNISFINCSVAEWSTRNCSNSSERRLFNSSQYSFNSSSGILNISFTPGKNDVGSYIINFSVTDNSNLGNKTTSQIVNFSVLNTNSYPYFRYICDNERNATDDSIFTCWINVSDIDETFNLTLRSNYSWFIFDISGINNITLPVNISTNYNMSAMINFTPTDINVGNWSINLTLTDIGTGFPASRMNSTQFWFFVNNTEDNVSLGIINNLTIYENQTIYVNATDNDLLVPDKSVKNEILTFASNTSWVSISSYLSSGNYTTARIQVDYSSAILIGAGNYSVNINVSDTGGNSANRTFVIEILDDSPVEWDSFMVDNFIIYENNLTYFNFSQNVSDLDGDSITFSFTNDSAFPSFSINSTTGIINFTPIDEDVGYHNITVNANDGKMNSFKSFNLTVYNVNDNLSIDSIENSGVINATVDANSNVNITEDNRTTITLWIYDDDLKIPSNQKAYYNESFNVSVNISGVNSSLFRFLKTSSFPTSDFPNKTEYSAVFTPGKADIGIYSIIVNVTDKSNFSQSLIFNLTIFEKQHNPIIADLSNQTSYINSRFYYRINATDTEDGNSSYNGNTNFTFSYNFTSGAGFLNSTTFNSTTGEINISFNSTNKGRYHLNITVNDSSGLTNSKDFWIYVYDIPVINFPESSYNFNLAENSVFNLTFKANHSVYDNLTYVIYIKNSNDTDILRYNLTNYYGNNTNFTWQFTPNFTDETYGTRNLTLMVINPIYSNLNASSTWNITINHTNAPVNFTQNLGKHQADYNSVITINLSSYLTDYDYSDPYYNQTINFTLTNESSLTYISGSFSGWILTLSSLVQTAFTEFLIINATDIDNETNLGLTSSLSNLFEIEFTTPTTTTVEVPSSGGGGGGSSTIPVAFKIITPGKISAYAYQKIIIPLGFENKGNNDFDGINITSLAFKDGNIQNKVKTSLSKSYITSLKKNANDIIILTVFFDTNNTGDYEILINATSRSPKYTDWAKIYISLQEVNESQVRELLIFTEEFLAKNPECIELTGILNEAKKYFENGDLVNSMRKVEEALNSCKESVAQPGLANLKFIPPFTLNTYLMIATIASIFFGIVYYLIRRREFKKMIKSVKVIDKKTFSSS